MYFNYRNIGVNSWVLVLKTLGVKTLLHPSVCTPFRKKILFQALAAAAILSGIAIGGFAYVQGLNFANNIADRVYNVEDKFQTVDGLVSSLSSLSSTVSSLSSTVSSLSSTSSSESTYVTNICTTVSHFLIILLSDNINHLNSKWVLYDMYVYIICSFFLFRSNHGLPLQEPQPLLNLRMIQLREETRLSLLALRQFHPQLVLKSFKI